MSQSKPTRRKALGMMLIAASASVGFLGTSGLLIFLRNDRPSRSKDVTLPDANTQQPPVASETMLSITVSYVGMTSLVGTTKQNIEIPAPAHLSDVISELCKEHPILQTMTSMQILLNGVAPEGNPMLRNGDQVALLAVMVGG